MISPHGTEHPQGTQVIPHIYHGTPTVLNTLHSTQDSPHGTHDIPHGTEHPTVLSTPTVLHTHYTGWKVLHGTNWSNFSNIQTNDKVSHIRNRFFGFSRILSSMFSQKFSVSASYKVVSYMWGAITQTVSEGVIILECGWTSRTSEFLVDETVVGG